MKWAIGSIFYAGLGCLVYGGFLIHPIVGWVGLGIVLVTISVLMHDELKKGGGL
jgi:hypothetical protein